MDSARANGYQIEKLGSPEEIRIPVAVSGCQLGTRMITQPGARYLVLRKVATQEVELFFSARDSYRFFP